MVTKYPFWVLKSDARRLLKGKWNAVVLSLFIPFLLYVILAVKLAQAVPQNASAVQLEKIMMIQYAGTIGFSVLLELIMVGIFRNLQPNQEKASCLNIYAVGFGSFFKLLPTMLITLGVPFVCNLLLSSDSVTKFYDYLMFSLMSIEVYGVLVQLVSLFLELFMLYLTLSLTMVPCILANHPTYGGIRLIKESFSLMKGNRLYFVAFSFSFVGWILLGSLAFTIGILWALAYMMAAQYAYYRRLAFEAESVIDVNEI
ncbi:MAG: DUF975 family protein [Clostridia bacterium]|nr:DUF975 family protein [Clostridia bacterium]